MITGSIVELLLNKYVLGSVGVLVALIIAYFKGSSSATKALEAEKALLEKAQQSRIRAAEAKNQFLEKKGEQQNEKINSGSTIDDLLGMWNEIQSSKAPGTDSDKNPK